MINRKRLLPAMVLIIVLLITEGTVEAQDYRTAIGLRFGGTSGITVKHNYSEMGAFEGILGFFNNGFSLTGLIERHPQAFNTRGLHWYYGGGAHLAIYDEHERFEFGRSVGNREVDDIGFGINGIIGLEYKFPDNVPIALSIGLKPFIEIDTDGDVGFAPDPGFGLKFLIL